MTLAINVRSIVLSLVIGAVIGYIGGPALALILWAIVGLTLGAFCSSNKVALVIGAVYGFSLSYVFMLAGYDGQASVTTKLLPFILFGVFGALCGSVLAIIGSWLGRSVNSSR